jgi:O-methyltransferase involved in polyketide biosynthesis
MKEPGESPVNSESANDKISQTALMVSYRRTFTDIPYSKEIFQALEKESGEVPDELKTADIAPQIEARYKLINRLLLQNGITQIFEFAAGFSPRGLELTANPNITYVESDLPNVYYQKRRIIKQIVSDGRPNLYPMAVDATEPLVTQVTATVFDIQKLIAVVNEGLLRYLNLVDKSKVATNVNFLLQRFGGIWVTSDIILKETLAAENDVSKGKTGKINRQTGIDVSGNSFDSIDNAQEFFEKLGFLVEQHSFMEVIDELVSPQRLGQQREQVEKLLKDPVVFVMRLK